jgi:hypothetical protein
MLSTSDCGVEPARHPGVGGDHVLLGVRRVGGVDGEDAAVGEERPAFFGDVAELVGCRRPRTGTGVVDRGATGADTTDEPAAVGEHAAR